MQNALLQGRIAAESEELLRRELEPEWQVLVWHPAKHSIDAFAPRAREADVIIGGNIPTAHESGWTHEQVARRWRFVAENANRVMAGEAPHNFVFTGTGG